MNQSSFRFGEIKISNSVFFILFFPLFFILGLTSHISHLSEINMESSLQKDFIIDGYYYIYLANEVKSLVNSGGGLTFIEASNLLAPNKSTSGTLLLSSLMLFFITDIELVPVIFLFIYFLLLLPQIRSNYGNLVLIFILFSGLLPYLFIPSKESFFLIGFLLFMIAIKPNLHIIFTVLIGFLSALIMFLARSEAFYILLSSIFFYYLYQRKFLFFIFLSIIVSVYIFYLRDIAYDISLAFQISAEVAGTSFCKVGFLDVCINEKSNLEYTFFQRGLSILALPLKWVYDVFISFGDPELLTVRNLLTRISLVFQILWAYLSYNKIKKNGISIGLIFCFTYIFAYTFIFYYQFTRPIIFATSVLFIFSSFNLQIRSTD